MAGRFTEEQLAQLTEEEREGLLDEDIADEGDGEDGDGQEAAAAASAGGDESADDASAGGQDEAEDGDDVAAAGAGAPDAGAAEAVQQEQPGAEAEGAAAQDEAAPAWVLPGDFDDRLKGLKDEKKQLAVKFDEGELTGAEFHEQLSALDEQYDVLRGQKIEASIAWNAAKREFGAAVNAFLTDHPQYEQGSMLYSLLDAEVRRLQGSAVNPLNPDLLAKAHARIAADIEKAYGVKPAAKPEQPKKAAAAQAQARRPAPPPSLASVPAADIEDTDDGGEFSALDRLADRDRLGYEKALADLRRKSPDAYDRYMAM